MVLKRYFWDTLITTTVFLHDVFCAGIAICSEFLPMPIIPIHSCGFYTRLYLSPSNVNWYWLKLGRKGQVWQCTGIVYRALGFVLDWVSPQWGLHCSKANQECKN